MVLACRINETGSAEKLVWEDVALPAPEVGEVRLAHRAVGLNFIDIYHRTGLYPLPLPSGIGLEASGVVQETGPGVADFQAGDRVAYAGGLPGAYAYERIVPQDRLVRIPDEIAFETAAAFLLKGLTAHFLLHDCFKVQAGAKILVQAAAGGVGQILTQWAARKGAWVIAVVGSAAKVALAKEAGAAHVIDASAGDFVPVVRELTDGLGVDVVYDSVGQESFLRGLDCLRSRGMMVSFGQSGGKIDPVDLSVFAAKGSLFFTRPSLFHYTAAVQELRDRAAAVFAAMALGTFKTQVTNRFKLQEAAKAHLALEARQLTGATVLLP